MAGGRTSRALGLAALALGLTVVMTYPLAFRPGEIGRVNTGDGFQGLWNVAWVARALGTDPLHVFDANIFHPHRNTLAFLEANLGAGAIAAPAWWLSRNPYLTYNVAALLGYGLSFLAMFGLARHLTGSAGAAIVSAITFAFSPYVFARTAHISLQMTFVLPLALWAFHRFIDLPTMARATALGLALWLAAPFCGYYAVFAGLTIGLAVLTYAALRGLWRRLDYWGAVAWAAAVSIVLVVPLYLPYLRLQAGTGFLRDLEEARLFSADWQAYLASSAWAHRWMLPLLENWNDVLFPGVVATTLGLVGVGVGLRAEDASQEPRRASIREATIFYSLLAVLAFWASFGPRAGLYSLFYQFLPIFSLMHVPSRFGLLVGLALSVLGAITVERVARGRRARAIVATLAIVTLAELATFPLPIPDAIPVNGVYTWLAKLPRGPVAEFPFFYERPIFHRHAYYMFNSTYHWQPLINGYADFFPADFREMVLPLNTFPSRDAFRRLQLRDARYVVVHLDLYHQRGREKVLDGIRRYREYLRPLAQDGDVLLYEIVRWPAPPTG